MMVARQRMIAARLLHDIGDWVTRVEERCQLSFACSHFIPGRGFVSVVWVFAERCVATQERDKEREREREKKKKTKKTKTATQRKTGGVMS